MNPPRILIVGAGAMGMVTGYHLSLAGVAVTFYVRPARLAELHGPQRLYCYDDATLKEFSNYQVITTIAAAAEQPYDYVLITLDGAACRTDDGSALLRNLGNTIQNTSAQMLIGGVGVGLREHFLETTGLHGDRLFHGVLGLLSHQVAAAQLPVHPPTNPALLSQASMAYRHFANQVGFSVASPLTAQARAFAAAYNRSKVSRCAVMGMTTYNIMANAFFPLTAVCELAGWPGTDELLANKELWPLCCKSIKEIVALPQHGMTGKLLSLALGPMLVGKLVRKFERESRPLDFHQFNRFHHGAKVRAQDIQVMRNCLQSGESQGQQMPTLKRLIQRLNSV